MLPCRATEIDKRRASMRHPYLASLAVVSFGGALLWVAPAAVAGQSRGTAAPAARPAAPRPTTGLRTAWGDPDLQGVWHVTAQVPLERAQQYAGREFLTDEEVAELDKAKGINPGRNARAAAGTAQD